MSRSTDSSRTKNTLAETLAKRAKAHERETRLRARVDQLSRQLDRERDRSELFTVAIHQAVQDSIDGMNIPPVPVAKSYGGRHHGAEVAIALLSDLQLAKVTPTYNSTVAAQRVEKYAEKVKLLTEIQRHDHPVNAVRVYLLGDIVEGELIFPHQPYQIDASLTRQVKDGAEIVAKYVRALAGYFPQVHVVGVIGNHGFLGPMRGSRYNPETNSDRMLYLWARDICHGEKRITWNIPWERNESSWYVVDYPFYNGVIDPGHKINDSGPGFLLFHGHQIPGGANHSDGTIARHIYGWASGAVAEPFTYSIYGHWHRPRSSRFNRFRFWCNGSVESTNTYAQEKLAAIGFPEQYLLFASPERVTAEYLVDLS